MADLNVSDSKRPNEGAAIGVHIPTGGSVESVVAELPTEKGHAESAQGYNYATWSYHLPREIRRLAYNWNVLDKRHKSGVAMGIETAPKAAPGTPVIVFGSGPSADKCIPLLKDWMGGIICSTSHGQTLRRYGIEPDIMIALDSDSNAMECGPWELWKGTKTALLTQPLVDERREER